MESNQGQWSIAEVAKSAGISSRSLRHYDAIGLLIPSSVSPSGYRFYGQPEVLRLQQILGFKELGLGLSDIAAILDSEVDPVARLEELSLQFSDNIERLQRQRESIHRAISIYRSGGTIVPTELFDGFDHTEYQQEVEERWGKQAYADADAWWNSMTEAERGNWRAVSEELTSAWTVAAARGIEPDSALAQELAARQDRWLSSMPGTPGAGSGHADSGYLLGLGELYVADERFASNYGGVRGAEFVAAALRVFVERRDGSVRA
ncbi:MAG: MerR family transcriptional regulator [Actinomycetota bacterium]|nr:MerR family transcriptional regulator [Actinomycetota bacterium]